MAAKRQSAPEALAYEIVRGALEDLMKVEAALEAAQQAAFDPERARHLAALRQAIEQLIRATPGSPD